MKIRHSVNSDSESICAIYNHYIENTIITFEEEKVTPAVMSQRIASYSKNFPWLILENDQGFTVGYAYAAKWAERSAYKNTVEITVYLDHTESGKGYGSQLYKALLSQLSKAGFHTVIAVIALPNAASVKLQESFGFTKVGHFSEVGRKFDQWVDVGYWQVKL